MSSTYQGAPERAVIKLRHGEGTTLDVFPGASLPANALLENELGYEKNTGTLWIGTQDGGSTFVRAVGAQYIINANGEAMSCGSSGSPIYLEGGLFKPCGSGTTLPGNIETATRWQNEVNFITKLDRTTAQAVHGGETTTQNLGVTGVLSVANGGTGKSSQTENRLCWTDSSGNITSGNHYADANFVCIKYAAVPSHSGFTQGLYIGSDAKIRGRSTLYLSSGEDTSVVLQSGGSGVFKAGHDGNCYLYANGNGYFLKDKASNEYPGVIDNGTNLWLGATQSQSKHHVGGTCISAGYDSTNSKGNKSIYIAIPNDSNNNSSTYLVHHEGLDPVRCKGRMKCGALYVAPSGDSFHNYTGFGTGGPTNVTAEIGRVYFQVVD